MRPAAAAKVNSAGSLYSLVSLPDEWNSPDNGNDFSFQADKMRYQISSTFASLLRGNAFVLTLNGR